MLGFVRRVPPRQLLHVARELGEFEGLRVAALRQVLAVPFPPWFNVDPDREPEVAVTESHGTVWACPACTFRARAAAGLADHVSDVHLAPEGGSEARPPR